ncbi:MAG: hypothetical protein OXI01_19395 [Albidovulum sp.]|nr:hypothetical protein [Albidovulum sp.]
MTLLPEFDVLESAGLLTLPGMYGEKPVVAKLGKTSLIILERDGSPIAHWTLTAIRRRNPGKRPAIFAPFGEGSEFIAIDDETMVRALEKVQNVLASGPAKPKRLRLALAVAGVVALAIAGAFAAPDFLVGQATALAQKSHRAEIGEALLVEHGLTAGSPCNSKHGTVALERLERRLFGAFGNILRIVPGGSVETAALPSETILVRSSLLRDRLGPEVFSGYILREKSRAKISDPLRAYFEIAGPLETLLFLAFRRVDTESVRSAANEYFARIPVQLPAEELRLSFEKAGIPLAPFVDAAKASGDMSLMDAQPEPATSYRTVLSDTDWLYLQSICSDRNVR